MKVVATQPALYFFDPAALDPAEPARPARNPEVVVLDEDEWPGQAEGRRWQRGEPVLHIRLRRWADLLLIAPLDANTLAKLAGGLSDNCLTCVWRAWERGRPVVLAPAMNTLMWEHRLTTQHLLAIAGEAGVPELPGVYRTEASPERAVEWINQAGSRLRIVSPVSKRLACGDVGIGGLAEPEEIVALVKSLLAQ